MGGAERYIDALILEEARLRGRCSRNPSSDLEQFRSDVEGDHDEIEQWSFRGGWIFVSVGSADDEADVGKGHGWMSRLVDSGALTAAGFESVRKADIQ